MKCNKETQFCNSFLFYPSVVCPTYNLIGVFYVIQMNQNSIVFKIIWKLHCTCEYRLCPSVCKYKLHPNALIQIVHLSVSVHLRHQDGFLTNYYKILSYITIKRTIHVCRCTPAQMHLCLYNFNVHHYFLIFFFCLITNCSKLNRCVLWAHLSVCGLVWSTYVHLTKKSMFLQ